MTASAEAATATIGPRVAEIVDLGLRACTAYGRRDLADRLQAVKRTLADPAIHIVVAGDFKQGKSSLVNSLLGITVCPVDDDIATAVPTYLRYGPEFKAELLREGDPPRRDPIDVADIRKYVVEPGRAAGSDHGSEAGPNGDRPAGVIVQVPRKILESGLVIVDTPGVGGLNSAHAAASLAAISMADAVLFVTDASQELTSAEFEFLRRAREMCETVVCVITKSDFYPAWRTIRDLDVRHLQSFPGIQVVAVSSALRARAIQANDQALNTESGFADLVSFVSSRVAGGAVNRLAANAAAEVAAICDQIATQFEAERTVLADPTRGKQVIDDLTEVKTKVEALRSAAARWSQTLNDGIADLNSDVDHDLRARIRDVVNAGDELVDEYDPADVWHEVEGWLESRVAEELVANYAFLRFKADELSEEVYQHFQAASSEVFDRLTVYNPTELLNRAEVDNKIDLEKMSVSKQAMTALKGSYMGILMFTMLGSMAGLALGPLAVGIGLVMGVGSLRTEKKRQLLSRRSQAKNAIRRYCDEVSFRVGKDSRDTLRRIQRELRDHYSTRAEELNRSCSQALSAAQEAANRTTGEAQKRLKDLDAELARLRQLRGMALAVTG
ncbi:MAG: dynamin family protein [Sporichthyaceae bacterium]|nr:dynamin family protein [Sporichthyaceae bacterium]